jgi:tetratricopeptide (TPR) repeat protein
MGFVEGIRLFDLDEVEFIDCVKEYYNLVAAFATEDRVHKFITDAKKATDKEDYFNAIGLLEKALESAEGNKKAEVLFYKGICLFNIRQEQAASRDFIEAVKIDPLYQQRVLQVLNPKK